MTYKTSVPFSGDVTRALDMAIAALTALGFAIHQETDSSVELTGPGMTSTRQSPLLGVSYLRLEARSRQLSAEAELGGVRWMCRFVLFFPGGLSLVLFAVLVAVFAIVQPQALPVVVTIGGIATGVNILVWLLLAPVISRYLHTRCCRAIDMLLSNMAAVAGQA